MKTFFILPLVFIYGLAFADSNEDAKSDLMPMEMYHHHDMQMENDTSMDHSKMDMNDTHDMTQMNGMLGSYIMTREASGTSWQPDSSSHEGIHQMLGDWSLMVHGLCKLSLRSSKRP